MKVVFEIFVPMYVKKWLFVTHKCDDGNIVKIRRNSLTGLATDLGCEIELCYAHRYRPRPEAGLELIKIEMQADTKNVGLTTSQGVRLAVLLEKQMRAECVAYVRGFLSVFDSLPDDWQGIDDQRPEITKEARYRKPLLDFRAKYGIDDDDLEYDRLRKWYRDVQ